MSLPVKSVCFRRIKTERHTELLVLLFSLQGAAPQASFFYCVDEFYQTFYFHMNHVINHYHMHSNGRMMIIVFMCTCQNVK